MKNYLLMLFTAEICYKSTTVVIHMFYNEIFLDYILINSRDFTVNLKFVQLYLDLNV